MNSRIKFDNFDPAKERAEPESGSLAKPLYGFEPTDRMHALSLTSLRGRNLTETPEIWKINPLHKSA